jgi:hypothetical protein
MPDEEGQREKEKKQECLMQWNLPKSFEHGAYQFESEAGSLSSGNHFSNVKEIKLTRGCHGKRTSLLEFGCQQQKQKKRKRKK